MTFPRRRFLRLAAAAAVSPAFARLASAQTYPTRPVHWIIGFPAGGGIDIISRLLAQRLSERLGQQFVIENRPGAGGNLAVEGVVRAPADGYMLTYVGPNSAINATYYKKLNFDFLRDIAPIAGFVRVPNVMVVNLDVPAKTVPDFIAYAKANPGKINMASSGNGTVGHVSGELFKMMTGVNMLNVPYRGETPTFTDLMAGQVQVTFNPMPGVIELVRGGKVRALAVTTTTRSENLPDLPVLADFVPGYESSTWYGVGAPKNTPVEIIDRLNKEINSALTDPKIKAFLEDLGGMVIPDTPAAFGKLIAEETEKWAKVVKFAGISAD